MLSHLGFDASDQYLRFGSLDFFGFDSPYVTLDCSCTSIRFILYVAETSATMNYAGEDQNKTGLLIAYKISRGRGKGCLPGEDQNKTDPSWVPHQASGR